ncbi:ribonuclease P protein component [Nocardioides baekrokdamisoli]|uniref:ribonuclease P protein component n=1 Tax=Nocardioides baekrokdamisoli TaxID=1804624 RepID=UPI000F7702B5|nr:ribonuclease P protein component [Nocardioides baekrokdamisoli]
MLPRAHRITEPAEFRTTVRAGRRCGGALLTVHLASPSVDDTGEADAARVGFVTSKAVGSAVARNRVKRRLRELARTELDSLPPGSRLVVRAQPASGASSYEELRGEFRRCLDRVLSSGRTV